MKRVAIFGAGNAGQAAAAHMTKMGLDVRLYNRWANEIEAIGAKGGIQLEGVVGSGFYKLPVITTDLKEAVEGADLYWVATPAVAHEFLAQELAPLLPEGAKVFLNPGSSGVLFSTLPGNRREELFAEVHPYYKTLVPMPTVLDTAFANVKAVMHPAGMLMNAGWIESTGGNFRFYTEGGTASVGRVIDQLERERRSTMLALGLDPKPFVEVFYLYGATSKEAVESGSCYVALRDSERNKEIKAPPNLQFRFLTEDVPFGIVPYRHLAGMAGVETPVISALILLASVVNGVDWLSTGLTLEKMGLKDVTKFTLHRFLAEGRRGDGRPEGT